MSALPHATSQARSMSKTVTTYKLWVGLDLSRAAQAAEKPDNHLLQAKLLSGAMKVAQKANLRGGNTPTETAALKALHGEAAGALSMFLLDYSHLPLPPDFAYSAEDVLPSA